MWFPCVSAILIAALISGGDAKVEINGTASATPTLKLGSAKSFDGDLKVSESGRKDRQTNYHSQQDSKPQSYSHSYDSGPQYYESTSKPVRYYREYNSPPSSYSHSYNTGPRSSSHSSPPQRSSHRSSYNHEDGDERSYDSENDRGHDDGGHGGHGGGDEYGGSNYENNDHEFDINDEGYGAGGGEGDHSEH